jgi:hypothetical protein
MKADLTTHVSHIRTLLRRFWPLWVLGLVIIIEVAAQLLYPQARTLPLARYNHEFYGFRTTDELSALEQEKFRAAQLQLASGTYQAKTLLSAAGAELDEEKSAHTLTAYDWRWRIVPFSIFFIRPEVSHLPVSFHAAPLGEFATKTAQAASRPAKDATLSLKDGRVEATNGEEGYAVSDQAIKKALSAYSYDINGVNRIDIPGAAVQPAKRASDLQDVYAKVQAAVEKRLTITVKDRSYTPTSAEIASWLELTGDDGTTDVRINSQTLGVYLDTIDKDVRVLAGTVTVRYVDGREQSREGGEAGEQIDRTNITMQLTDKLFAQSSYAYVNAKMVVVPPTEKREYSYSNSQEGVTGKSR